MELEFELREMRRDVRENTAAVANLASKQSTLEERIENLRQLRLMEDFPVLRADVARISGHLANIQDLIIKRTPIVDALVPRVERNEKEWAPLKAKFIPDLEQAQRDIEELRADVLVAKQLGKKALWSIVGGLFALLVFIIKEGWYWFRDHGHL